MNSKLRLHSVQEDHRTGYLSAVILRKAQGVDPSHKGALRKAAVDVWFANFKGPRSTGYAGCGVAGVQGASTMQKRGNNLCGALKAMHVERARWHSEVRGSTKGEL